MAYRKTEKVAAQIEARRTAILAAAIDTITKSGIESLVMDRVAERAGVSVGLAYKHFADVGELREAVVTQLLARDLDAVRQAAATEKTAVPALAAAVTVLYARMDQPRLVAALFCSPRYRFRLRVALADLIREAVDLTPKDRAIAAGAVLGAVHGVYDACDGARNKAPAAVLAALRAIGVGEAVARKFAGLRYSLVLA